MTTLIIERVNALPQQIQPLRLYIVKASDPTQAEIYVSSADGSEVRHLLNKADVASMIAAATFGDNGSGSGVASSLAVARSISINGDAQWTVNFDGSANVNSAITLSTTGVTEGSYAIVTVDAKGRVLAGRALTSADIPGLDASIIISGTLSRDTTGNAASATKLQIARSINGVLFDGSGDITIPVIDNGQHIAVSEKGANSGVATLDAAGKVPTSQLPSYVDDVIEAATFTAFPNPGETGKIYVAIDTERTYRWSGSLYIEISANSDTGSSGNLSQARNIAATGDINWNVNFDGSANVSAVASLSATGVVAGSYSKVTVNESGRITSGTVLTASDIPNHDASRITTGTLDRNTTGNAATATKLQTARTINGTLFDGTANITISAVDSTSRIASSEKGAVNGVATLDASGKVTASQLPAGSNEIVMGANYAIITQAVGDANKLYIAQDTNKIYRWNGVGYLEVSAASPGNNSNTTASVIYTQPVRYEINSTPGYKAYCTTSAPVYTGIAWTRSGNQMVVQHENHGRTVADRIIIKDTNVPFLNSLITAITADTYTVTCSDSGAISGNSANYTVGIKFAHNSEVAGTLTGGTVTAPANVDILLHSLRIRTKANSRTGATYDLVLPISVYTTSMGSDTDMDGVYLPVHQIRGDADTLPAVANTIAVNQGSGGYHTIRFSALGATTQGQLMLLQF